MAEFNPFSLDSFLQYGFILALFAGVIGYIAYKMIKDYLF